MADFDWPTDLYPYQVSFYLQPHVGGSESPFSRQRKVYGLSAPRWVCRLAFRGGYNGTSGIGAYGPRLDALIAQLEGGLNRVSLWDFRRESPAGLLDPEEDDPGFFTDGTGFISGGDIANAAVGEGASTITVTGVSGTFRPGDYVGGDGRPHIVTSVTGTSTQVLTVKPPFRAAIEANEAVFTRVPGMFRLTSEDAGANGTEVGELVSYDLEFVEDLSE